MKQLELLHEGKSKQFFKTDSDEHIIIRFKDDASAFYNIKYAKIENKGKMNCTISSAILGYLAENGVKSHFVEKIDETETNIRLAGMLLSELDAMLRIPSSTPKEDRLSIILASYNAGIGHVLDARRLARAEGANPNSWEVVSHYLRMKATPEYYEHEVVQNGRFTGSGQTLSYVKEVMSKYSQYCNLASLS